MPFTQDLATRSFYLVKIKIFQPQIQIPPQIPLNFVEFSLFLAIFCLNFQRFLTLFYP